VCTAFVRVDPDSAWPIRVAFVRDEDRARPTAASGRWWPDQPHVIGGRDERAGGTWLAMSDDPAAPAIAFLLNRHEPNLDETPPPNSRSRGELPLRALADEGFDHAHLDLDRYAPFHLVHATMHVAHVWHWDGAELQEEALPAGTHMIASRGITLPGEADRRVAQLARCAAAIPPDPAPSPTSGDDEDTRSAWGPWLDLLDGRAAVVDDLSSVVVAGITQYPRFGTVGASLVALANTGQVRYDINVTNNVDCTAWSRVDLST